MLVLTRRVGEALMLSDNCKIQVLAIHKGIVRLGIDAPKEISVHREEIYNRIKAGLPKPEKVNNCWLKDENDKDNSGNK